MSKKPKSVMELIPLFIEIIEDLENIKKKIVKQSEIKYESQDARMVFLDSSQRSISAVVMWIQCIFSLEKLNTKEGVLNEANFLQSVGSTVNIETTGMIMFNHLRLSFITLIHFKIDNLFQNILKHLKISPKEPGYWYLTDAILEQCSILKIGDEKNILTAFANIRNSLHGNGIHRKDNLSIVVKEVEFNFIKNKPIECSSWEHIVILLKEQVKILEKIILSSKIIGIKTEIKDDFASWLNEKN